MLYATNIHRPVQHVASCMTVERYMYMHDQLTPYEHTSFTSVMTSPTDNTRASSVLQLRWEKPSISSFVNSTITIASVKWEKQRKRKNWGERKEREKKGEGRGDIRGREVTGLGDQGRLLCLHDVWSDITVRSYFSSTILSQNRDLI